MAPFLGSGTLAITLGQHVFLGEVILRRGSDEIETTLRHELEHVRQFAHLGLAGFVRRYAGDYIRNRRSGLSPYEAYHRIGLEAEARLAETAPHESKDAGERATTA